MAERDRLLDLIEHLYAAPGTGDGWSSFLGRLCDARDGVCAHFISVDQAHRASVAMTIRTDPAALVEYKYWGAHDPWGLSPKLHAAQSGQVLLDEELVAGSQLIRTAYYNEFSRHFDLVRSVIGVIENGPRTISVISLGGNASRRPFAAADTAFMKALMPHLHRALQLHRRLATADEAVDDFRLALNRRARALFLVNGAGNVTTMSDAATRLTAARDGLVLDGTELRAARASDTTRFRALVAGATATAAGVGMDSGGTLALGRPSGRRPLMAVVAPFSGRRGADAGVEAARAIVVVSDPERGEIPGDEILRMLFELTPAEAALTRLLAEGLTLEAAASRLGVRTGTVRTRVKAIFEKTSTHGQVDLVRLLRAIQSD